MTPTEKVNKFKESLQELGSALMILINTTKAGVIVIILLVSTSLSLTMVVNAQQREIDEQKATIKEQTRLISEHNSQKQAQEDVKDQQEEIKQQEQQTQQEPSMRSLGVFELTAYCPCSHCSSSWSRTTATGTTATAGRTIGVNPDIIPYGTRVIINGHEYIAEDTGGAMREKPYLIDVFMETHEEALIFGRQKAEVFILEQEEFK